jgi:hypothetical protein
LQGYLISRPIAAAAVVEKFASRLSIVAVA